MKKNFHGAMKKKKKKIQPIRTRQFAYCIKLCYHRKSSTDAAPPPQPSYGIQRMTTTKTRTISARRSGVKSSLSDVSIGSAPKTE